MSKHLKHVRDYLDSAESCVKQVEDPAAKWALADLRWSIYHLLKAVEEMQKP